MVIHSELIASEIIEKAINGLDYASLLSAHDIKLDSRLLDEIISKAAVTVAAKKLNDYEGRKFIRDAVDSAIIKECVA